MTLNFWSSYFYFLNTRTTGTNHHSSLCSTEEQCRQTLYRLNWILDHTGLFWFFFSIWDLTGTCDSSPVWISRVLRLVTDISPNDHFWMEQTENFVAKMHTSCINSLQSMHRKAYLKALLLASIASYLTGRLNLSSSERERMSNSIGRFSQKEK